MRRMLLTGMAIAMLAVTAASAEAAPASFWGIQPFDRPAPDEAELMKRTGVAVARVEMRWRQVEPNEPTLLGGRNYHWGETDAWVRELASNQMRALVVLASTPSWVAASLHETPVTSKKGRKGWRDYVRAIVERYGRGGTFWQLNPTVPYLPVRQFQVWNEQNSAARYEPSPDPASYKRLLRIASESIRAEDRRADVVLGGMFGTPRTDRGSILAWRFLRALYDRGAAKHFDVVGVHPYAPGLRGVRYQVERMRKVMRKAGRGRDPLAVTEIGWSSARSDDFFFFAGPKGQARKMRRAFGMFVNNRRKWKIQRVFWLAWRDTGSRPGCGYCARFGIVRKDLSRKPAYKVYKRYANGRLP